MRKLIGLTTNAKQNLAYPYGEDVIALSFCYSWINLQWLIGVRYKNFTLQEYHLTAGYNALSQYRGVLKWGLRVISVDGEDPYYIDDFTSGRISIYLLDAEEALQTTNYLMRENGIYVTQILSSLQGGDSREGR